MPISVYQLIFFSYTLLKYYIAPSINMVTLKQKSSKLFIRLQTISSSCFNNCRMCIESIITVSGIRNALCCQDFFLQYYNALIYFISKHKASFKICLSQISNSSLCALLITSTLNNYLSPFPFLPLPHLYKDYSNRRICVS